MTAGVDTWENRLPLIAKNIRMAVKDAGGSQDSLYRRIDAAVGGLRKRLAAGRSGAYLHPAMAPYRILAVYENLFELHQALSDKGGNLERALRGIDAEESKAVSGLLLGAGLLLVLLSVTFYLEQRRISE